MFSIFEFVHTLLENNKFKTTVKKALPELIYYIILYMQITEDQVGGGASARRPPPPGSHSHLLTTSSVAQIKAWTANPQQFVEDEDDDTFSYSVRISAQDLLLVRREPTRFEMSRTLCTVLERADARSEKPSPAASRPSLQSSRMRARQPWQPQPPGTSRRQSRPRTVETSTGEAHITASTQTRHLYSQLLLLQPFIASPLVKC